MATATPTECGIHAVLLKGNSSKLMTFSTESLGQTKRMLT